MTPSPGIEPRPHWWEASALPLRHHCFHFSQFLLIPFHMIHWRHIIFLILISRPTRISHVSQPILHGSKISAIRLNSTPIEFCSGFLIQLHVLSFIHSVYPQFKYMYFIILQLQFTARLGNMQNFIISYLQREVPVSE